MSSAVTFVDNRSRHYSFGNDLFLQRVQNFGDRITFHAPGLKRYQTSEYERHDANEFVAVSVTGEACALNCEHCKTGVLRGMHDLSRSSQSLYEIATRLHDSGAKGILISGGSDRKGRVPLIRHVPDMIRIRQQLKMLIRIHPGLPDERTCSALADVDIDGAMVDIIGHENTIRDVYHLPVGVEEYEAVLERLEMHGIPCIPHIVMGLHYGQMLGEEEALAMIARHAFKLLVLVILMPLSGTPMAVVKPPSMPEIAEFFQFARKKIVNKPIMLGCARPLGQLKERIDRAAIDAGFNGIAYPAEGIVHYASDKGLKPEFVNSCCGVTW